MAKSTDSVFVAALVTSALTLSVASTGWSDEPEIGCNFGAVSERSKIVCGFEVRFTSDGDKCHATVFSPIAEVVFETEAMELGVDR